MRRLSGHSWTWGFVKLLAETLKDRYYPEAEGRTSGLSFLILSAERNRLSFGEVRKSHWWEGRRNKTLADSGGGKNGTAAEDDDDDDDRGGGWDWELEDAGDEKVLSASLQRLLDKYGGGGNVTELLFSDDDGGGSGAKNGSTHVVVEGQSAETY